MSFIKGKDFGNSCTWNVLEPHGDHNYILIEALFSQSHYSYPRFKTAYGGHRRILQHLRQKTKQLGQQIEESNTRDHLEKETEELQKAIFTECRKAYKIKKIQTKNKQQLFEAVTPDREKRFTSHKKKN
ncbi:hypothetical protein AVEN_19680-1 [Araneus ventricosus]|uniref:Uncharacterized protein n=1 Tax=Araneus ventricosus TaxID=182803 RepID=A0A4Y2C4D6_ARAVE|nr:hypothetical protein AVEN_19680-1 [Araneus ventricosus]